MKRRLWLEGKILKMKKGGRSPLPAGEWPAQDHMPDRNLEHMVEPKVKVGFILRSTVGDIDHYVFLP